MLEKKLKLQDSECIRSLIVQNTNIVEKWLKNYLICTDYLYMCELFPSLYWCLSEIRIIDFIFLLLACFLNSF